MPDRPKFPCPCCGYLTFEEPPGSYDICDICGWEDDDSQLRFPGMAGGANKPSLIEAQKNFARFGHSDERRIPEVRSPTSRDIRDPGWAPADRFPERIERAATRVPENVETRRRAKPAMRPTRSTTRRSTTGDRASG